MHSVVVKVLNISLSSVCEYVGECMCSQAKSPTKPFFFSLADNNNCLIDLSSDKGS